MVWSMVVPILRRIHVPIPVMSVVLLTSRKPVFIVDGSDLAMFFEVFLDNVYAFKIEKPVKRILDLGANVGYASIYFAHIFKDAQIVAVEADMDNVQKMKMNIAPYGDRIMVEPCAIAPQKGRVDFYRNSRISGSTIMRSEKAEKVSVPATTLSDLEHTYGSFDVVKFDIEGGEWGALFPDMLTHQPAVWIGEYHNDLTKKPETDFISRFTGYEAVVLKKTKQKSIIIFK